MNTATIRYAGRRSRETLRSGALVLALAIAVFAAGDEVERYFAPILVEQRAAPIPIDGERPYRVCWTWSFRKARSGVPVEASWTLIIGGHRYAVVPTAPSGIPPRIANAPAGYAAEREFCALSPPGIDLRGQRVEVVGSMSYRTGWTPWLVRQEFPPVVWNDAGAP